MKKILFAIASMIFVFGVGGCSSQKEADTMMKCEFYQKDTEGEKSFHAFFTYVDEKKEAVSGDIRENYSGFERNKINNEVLTNILIRNSILDEIEGVEMEVTSNDTDFGSREEWNYRDVDLETVGTTDEIQNKFIDRNAGQYSIEMIQKYYETNGYSCSISNIE